MDFLSAEVERKKVSFDSVVLKVLMNDLLQ